MNRKLLVGGAILGLVSLLVWANLRDADQTNTAATARGSKVAVQGPATAPLVKVMTLKPRPMTQEVLAPALIEASSIKEIRAPFSSTQVQLLVGMGDRVTAGQLLATLDPDDLATRVLTQEAQVARVESSLASLRLQLQQAPLQLVQRLEQARAQLHQAEDGLTSAANQTDLLNTRLEQARANLELLQNRSAMGSVQVESARQALVNAESAYRMDPLNDALRAAYNKAVAAYDAALQESQESARQMANDLRRAYDDLAAAEAEYTRAGTENPVALQLAQRQVEAARINVQLAETEAKAGDTVAAQIKAGETELAAAHALLADLKRDLARSAITAPADGTILALHMKDDQPIQAGQLLLTLGNLNTMTITVRVDEIDIGKIQSGQQLTVRSTAHPQQRFEGKVVRVAAQSAESATGLGTYFKVEGEVVNDQALLRSGMNAEVTIATDKRNSALVVGLAAVREEDGAASILIVEEFRVKVQPVTLGLRTQTEVEILDGAKEGDPIIVSPFTLVNSLKNGDSVRTEPFEGDESE